MNEYIMNWYEILTLYSAEFNVSNRINNTQTIFRHTYIYIIFKSTLTIKVQSIRKTIT